MAQEPVVIVGAGHGGFQVAASLRQHGFDGPVTLIGDEPVLPYQRPPLSKDYLNGKIGLDLLVMRPENFYRDHRIDYLPGIRVSEIDRAAKAVRLASGERLGYGHLVLATGARNRVPALPGIELDGVCYLRTLAETDELRDRLAAAHNIVAIGAGFIGLEFAAVARGHGKSVHVVELTDRVMGRVASVPTSRFFAEAHRHTGVTFRFGAQTARIGGHGGRVDHVELAGGEKLPADLVLVSIGVVPNGEVASAAGLAVANGIVVNEELLTADPNISAIGDCASFPCRHAEGHLTRLEAVQNAVDHARCVADRLVGKPHPYAALPWFCRLPRVRGAAVTPAAARGTDAGQQRRRCRSAFAVLAAVAALLPAVALPVVAPGRALAQARPDESTLPATDGRRSAPSSAPRSTRWGRATAEGVRLRHAATRAQYRSATRSCGWWSEPTRRCSPRATTSSSTARCSADRHPAAAAGAAGQPRLVALYTIERQPDGQWRIVGCALAPSTVEGRLNGPFAKPAAPRHPSDAAPPSPRRHAISGRPTRRPTAARRHRGARGSAGRRRRCAARPRRRRDDHHAVAEFAGSPSPPRRPRRPLPCASRSTV